MSTEAEQPQEYTIFVNSENKIGILNRVSLIFTRRHINIDSLNVSASEIENVYRYTIVVQALPSKIENLVRQIEKQVEVISASYHPIENIIYQEIALYKMPIEALPKIDIESVSRKYRAHLLMAGEHYFVLSKTGHKDETQALLEYLKPYRVMAFVRSGRVAITRSLKTLEDLFRQLEKEEI